MDIIKPLLPATLRSEPHAPIPALGDVQPQTSISGNPIPSPDSVQTMKFNSPKELSGTYDPVSVIKEPVQKQ